MEGSEDIKLETDREREEREAEEALKLSVQAENQERERKEKRAATKSKMKSEGQLPSRGRGGSIRGSVDMSYIQAMLPESAASQQKKYYREGFEDLGFWYFALIFLFLYRWAMGVVAVFIRTTFEDDLENKDQETKDDCEAVLDFFGTYGFWYLMGAAFIAFLCVLEFWCENNNKGFLFRPGQFALIDTLSSKMGIRPVIFHSIGSRLAIGVLFLLAVDFWFQIAGSVLAESDGRAQDCYERADINGMNFAVQAFTRTGWVLMIFILFLIFVRLVSPFSWCYEKFLKPPELKGDEPTKKQRRLRRMSSAIQPMWAEALYSYEAEAKGDLSFEEGDRILVIDIRDPDGWWYGELDGKKGSFPMNYVVLHAS